MSTQWMVSSQLALSLTCVYLCSLSPLSLSSPLKSLSPVLTTALQFILRIFPLHFSPWMARALVYCVLCSLLDFALYLYLLRILLSIRPSHRFICLTAWCAWMLYSSFSLSLINGTDFFTITDLFACYYLTHC